MRLRDTRRIVITPTRNALRNVAGAAALAWGVTAGVPTASAQSAAVSTPPVVDAGFGRGVTIRTADDQMSLNIRGRVQVRNTMADTEEDGQIGTSEFLIRRMRLLFQGNAMGPRLTYYFQFSFANLDNESDLRLPLRDAYVTWAPARDFNLRMGQMKVPFARQRVVSSSALQMVDRSVVTSELNLDRDVGVQLFSRDLFGRGGRLGYAVGLFGGDGRNRLGRDFGYLYTARIEAWPFGQFDDIVEADIARSPKPRLAIAATTGYNQRTNRARSTLADTFPAGDVNYRHAAADMIFKKSGFSVISELMYRRADRELTNSTGAVVSRSGWGAYVQAGQMVTSRVEVNGRVGHLTPYAGTARTFEEIEEAGVGLSYYPRAHNLKVQGDYFQLRTGQPARLSHQVRVQLQLYF